MKICQINSVIKDWALKETQPIISTNQYTVGTGSDAQRDPGSSREVWQGHKTSNTYYRDMKNTQCTRQEMQSGIINKKAKREEAEIAEGDVGIISNSSMRRQTVTTTQLQHKGSQGWKSEHTGSNTGLFSE